MCDPSQSSAPGVSALLALVKQHIKPLKAPWLVPALTSAALASTSQNQHSSTSEPALIPTHVKHLKTSAPLNPRAAHEAKKAKQKQRKQLQDEGVYIAED